MSPRANGRRAIVPALLALLGFVVLPACSSIGDFGRLKPSLGSDDIHAWVGRDAATEAGAPISTNQLNDDERTLRDLAFPLIESTYDRQNWNAVVYEYGLKQSFRRELWIDDPTAYHRHLLGVPDRSIVARYNQLIDDIRNDIVRIEPFFSVARRVADLDRRREASMRYVADLSPQERANAQARVGENGLTIAWVQHSLTVRCASYRYALQHLAVAEPNSAAGEADRVLTQLQQQIAANELVPAPHFEGTPIAISAKD